MKFAGVAISNPDRASVWLKERLLDKKVWITLLDHTAVPAVDHLQCVVHANRRKVWDMENGMYITWNGEWNVSLEWGMECFPWNHKGH